MAEEIYEKLREQLDQYSVGYPKTESGVEIEILKRLYSEEDAQLYLDLSLMLEDPASVAQRTGRNAEATAKQLEDMAVKGLIFRKHKGDAVLYAAVPFVIGSFEFQVNRMDATFAQLTEKYFKEAFHGHMSENMPPLRTIPVGKSVDTASKVASYADAREIIKTKDKIALAECICRKQQGLIEKGCGKPLEACFSFGSHAEYYIENGMAKAISQEEALAILDQCEEAGLVNQPANMINPGGMCNCCGDCCGVLRSLRLQPKPAELVLNNYRAVVDAEECTGCEMCLERCQMDALSINDDDISVVDEDRCIGCGLCVTTCPVEAIELKLKPEDEWLDPPASGQDLMMQTAEKRGKNLMPLSMSGK